MSHKIRYRLLRFLLISLGVSICLVGCGGGGGGTSPENKPPVITSGPDASGITSSEAAIGWITDEACDSKVWYGKTASYTDSVVSDDPALTHSLTISDLTPATLYHYKVASRDAKGESATSADKTFRTLSVAEDLVVQGWQMFENGDHASALEKFNEARLGEPHNVAVLEGLGWTLLRLYRLSESLGALDEALSIEPTRLDCLVAAAFLYQALERFDDAIGTARQALQLGGNTYVFTHDDEIEASDLRYCLVVCLLAKGDLQSALAEAKIIDPSIDLDPDNPTTWDGYSTFEEALLAMVENLRSRT
jgi:hypothetical protein